jgi:hypothetical protein
MATTWLVLFLCNMFDPMKFTFWHALITYMVLDQIWDSIDLKYEIAKKANAEGRMK